MNKIEKLVYDFVKGNPRLKQKLRNVYQSFFDFLPNKKDYHINEVNIKEGYFFGFHDLTPFSEDDNMVLANRLTIPFRMPNKGDILEVGYFTLKDNQFLEYNKIGESFAWNYHKGCRLQWSGKSQIIYNDADGDIMISKVYSFIDGTTRTLPFPIDSISKDGSSGTSFSYGRLEKLMPGYGYAGYDDDSFLKEKTPAETGLYLVDISKGKKELIISIETLIQIGILTPEYVNCYHYVTHSLFSPDGKYISFLHRWVDISYTSKRHSRLVTFHIETKKCFVAPTNDMVSHYVWNNINQIVAYCRTGNVDSHVLFEEPTLQRFKRVAYPELNSDGHQSFADDTTFVTDTYPDKYRMANLYKVDCSSDEVVLLARLNSPKKFQSQYSKHWCCDLHPRMNQRGDIVCFDSVHTGKRALCLMKI